MSTLRFKRFSKPHVLKDIGRHLLGRFFAKFKDEMQAKAVTLPDQALDDEAYFDALVFHIKDLCKNIRSGKGCEFADALLRPHAAAVKFMLDMDMPVGDVFSSAKQAGFELANIRRPLCTLQQFEESRHVK